VGKTVPIIDGPVKKTAKKNEAAAASKGKRQITDPLRESGYEDTTLNYDTTLDHDMTLEYDTTQDHGTVQDYEADETVEDVVETTELAISYHEPMSIIWGLDHVDSKSRFCLGYCMSTKPPSSPPLTSHSFKQHSTTHRRYKHGL